MHYFTKKGKFGQNDQKGKNPSKMQNLGGGGVKRAAKYFCKIRA